MVAARTRNIAVAKGIGGTATGMYCVDVQGGIDPSAIAPVAALGFDGTPVVAIKIFVDTYPADVRNVCTAPTNDFVVLALGGTGSYVDADFTISVP